MSVSGTVQHDTSVSFGGNVPRNMGLKYIGQPHIAVDVDVEVLVHNTAYGGGGKASWLFLMLLTANL